MPSVSKAAGPSVMHGGVASGVTSRGSGGAAGASRSLSQAGQLENQAKTAASAKSCRASFP